MLALLLARVNSAVSVDALVDAVWGDRPPRTAERTVHAYVARLRRTLEPRRPRGEPSTLLATVGRGYELRLDAAQLDAIRFEELAKRGADQLAAWRRPRRRRRCARRWACGGVRRTASSPRSRRASAEARRLDELRLVLLEDRVDADLADGRIRRARRRDRDAARRCTRSVSGCGVSSCVALYRAGRQRDALDAYQRARRLLVDELGIEPGPELRRLEAAVLAQDPALDVLRPVRGGRTRRPSRSRSTPWVPRSSGRDAELGVAATGLGGRGRRARRLRVGAGTGGHRQDPTGRRAGTGGPRRRRRPCSTAAVTTPTAVPAPCSVRPSQSAGSSLGHVDGGAR